MAWEKLILVQSLDGMLGDVVRVIGDGAVIIHAGQSYSVREFPGRKYISVCPKIEANSFFNWMGLVNLEMIREGLKTRPRKVICIDWFPGTAATAISSTLNIPLVSVFTSTEQMRGSSEISGLIIEMERDLAENSYSLSTNPEVRRYLDVRVVSMEELGDAIEGADADMGIPAD